jgi:hypothetical protein
MKISVKVTLHRGELVSEKTASVEIDSESYLAISDEEMLKRDAAQIENAAAALFAGIAVQTVKA